MIKKRVFVAQPIAEAGVLILKKFFSVMVSPRHLSRRELARSLAFTEALVCTVNDVIDAAVLEQAPFLGCISNVAVGFNNIDLSAATRRGIVVTNTPDTLTDSVAEFVFAHLLAASRRLVEADNYIRQGKFTRWSLNFFLGGELQGKTLGIVGLGKIGKALVPLAHGFGMKILYTRRTGSEKQYQGGLRTTLQGVLKNADYVVLLVPLTKETKHLIARRELFLMKKNAVLVNMARGGIVNEKDLSRALQGGVIKAACLDVFENEPAISPELLKMKNVVLTPHIGSATIEARKRMALCAAQNVVDVLLKKSKCKNVVNAGPLRR